MSSQVYGYITEKIIALLDAGVCPWHRPWNSALGRPQNYDGVPYRGGNVFWLACQGFSSPYWLTAKKVKSLKGTFSGKSTMVIFWNWIKGKTSTDGSKEKGFPILRYYNVWNLEQCEGIPAPESKIKLNDFPPIESAEKILAETPVRPMISYAGGKACYSPELDKITVPPIGAFESSESYYSVMFHELGHATGHKTRLNRDLSGLFGDHRYSKEELIAEMTSAFLCGHCGIEDKTLDNSAAYLSSWKLKLAKDDKIFASSAACAQKASDEILGIKFQEKPEDN